MRIQHGVSQRLFLQEKGIAQGRWKISPCNDRVRSPGAPSPSSAWTAGDLKKTVPSWGSALPGGAQATDEIRKELGSRFQRGDLDELVHRVRLIDGSWTDANAWDATAG